MRIISSLLIVLALAHGSAQAQAGPFMASGNKVINGQNVTYVAYRTTSGAVATLAKANFRDETSKNWTSSAGLSCSETAKDEWSVYLACGSGAGQSQFIVNLYTKTVRQMAGATTLATSAITDAKDQLQEARVSGDERKVEYRLPLSREDTTKVMLWIATEITHAHTPYCYKDRYPNPASQPMTCKPGSQQETLGLCSKDCAAGEKGIAGSCYRNCPAGFADNGLYCGKPQPYGRGGGYAVWDKALCERDNPQGCEQIAALFYPKCRPGFQAAGSNVCSPACPAGWEDIGVSCKKPSTARPIVPVSECPAGTEKDATGALCYPTCKSGFSVVGPVCWQKCSDTRVPLECGVGCANNRTTCAEVTANMVLAPINMVLQVATLGMEGFGRSIAKQVADRAEFIARANNIPLAQAKEIANKALRLQAMGPAFQQILENLEKAEVALTIGSTSKDVALLTKSIHEGLEAYADAYNLSFSAATSGDIDRKIDEVFGGRLGLGTRTIKREWAKYHLVTTLQAEKWALTSKIVLNSASAVDFLGLQAVVAAFAQPPCVQANSNPFPNVRVLYR